MIKYSIALILITISLQTYCMQTNEMTVSTRFERLSSDNDEWAVIGLPKDYKDGHQRIEDLKKEIAFLNEQMQGMNEREDRLRLLVDAWQKRHRTALAESNSNAELLWHEQEEKEQLIRAHRTIIDDLIQKCRNSQKEIGKLQELTVAYEEQEQRQQSELESVWSSLYTASNDYDALKEKYEELVKQYEKTLAESELLGMQNAETNVKFLALHNQHDALQNEKKWLQEELATEQTQKDSATQILADMYADTKNMFLALQEQHDMIQSREIILQEKFKAEQRQKESAVDILKLMKTDFDKINGLLYPTKGSVAKRDMPQRQENSKAILLQFFDKYSAMVTAALYDNKSCS